MERKSTSSQKKIKFEDEESDFFINHLDAKISGVDLDLDQITEIKKKGNYSEEERNRIAQQKSLENDRDFYVRCMETYKEAQRTNGESHQAKSRTDLAPDRVSSASIKDKEVKNVAVRELVNLIYFCNFFSSAKRRNDFKDAFPNIKEGTHLDAPPDFDIYQEFYENLFDHPSDHKLLRVKIENTLDDLEHFVNGS